MSDFKPVERGIDNRQYLMKTGNVIQVEGVTAEKVQDGYFVLSNIEGNIAYIKEAEVMGIMVGEFKVNAKEEKVGKSREPVPSVDVEPQVEEVREHTRMDEPA